MTGTAVRVIRPRKAVEALNAYHPPIEGRREFIRLDFNENTAGFPSVYPDGYPDALIPTYPEYDAFIAQAAEYWNVRPEQVLLTNGSDEGLSVVAATFIEPGEDAALISNPTFALIPHYLRLAEAEVLEVPVLPNLQFDLITLTEILETRQQAGQPIKLVMLASPDNPTGAVLTLEQIRQWCSRYSDTLFTIDEAYAEYRNEDESAINLLPEFDNLMVTRTFSKAWGLAGLRLGAVLGHPKLVEYMRRVRSPYSVNVMAVETASRLLPKAPEVRLAALEAVIRKKELIQEIQNRGYEVFDGAGNFFLLCAGLDAVELSRFCHQNGVLVRDRSSHPLLRGMVRVSVGTDEENQKFLNVLDRFRETHALVFDLDDTLVDTSQSFSAVVGEMVSLWCPEQPLKPGELNALRAEGGYNDDWVSTRELLRRRGVDIPPRQIAEEGTRRYLACAKHVEKLLVPLEEIQCLAKRYRIFIVTGRSRCEYKAVWAEALDGVFEAILCVDDYPDYQPKPAPDYLNHILREYGIETGYYIGNNVDDMMSAAAAGLGRIAVTTTLTAETLTEAGAQVVLSSPEQIVEVFTR